MIPKLRGKRTYILAALAILTELVKWAVGDQSLGALVDHLPAIFGELSVATLRAGVAWQSATQTPHRENIEALLREVLAAVQATPATPATPTADEPGPDGAG
jgi:hypothetical protein